jgi:hypothetical protein
MDLLVFTSMKGLTRASDSANCSSVRHRNLFGGGNDNAEFSDLCFMRLRCGKRITVFRK